MWPQAPGGAFTGPVHLPALAATSPGAQDVMTLSLAPGGWLLACTRSGALALWHFRRWGKA